MSSSANIEPLHRNPAPQGNLQRKLFQRNFEGYVTLIKVKILGM